MKQLLIILLFGASFLFANIISPDRRTVWAPGLPGAFATKTVKVDVKSYGAVGDGKTDDSNAFINAIKAIPASGGVLLIPEGDFLLKKKLTIDKSVQIRGVNYQKTRLLFNLGERAENCIEFVKYDRGDWVRVLAGFDKGSRRLTVQTPGKFRADDFVEIQQENDPDIMYTLPDWEQTWAENAVGQICVVESIESDGTLVLNRPLHFSYSAALSPQIRTVGLIEYPGIEDLYIERLDAGDGYTIQLRYTAYARVMAIESYMTYRCHIYMSECYAGEVRNSYFHHAHDYGGGGHGYGIDTIHHTSDCLIIDNIFRYLRHSMMTHVGTSGNVFAYNFSTQREPQKLCDVSLHGHYSNANLFESNVVEEIDVSDWWGPIGPNNTFLRNVVTQEGIDVNDASHGQNLIGNVLNRSTIKINSGVRETLSHGNVTNGSVAWDPEIADQEIPVSYFLANKPEFLADFPWPLFGPDAAGDNKLPAQVRFETGNPIAVVKEKITTTPQDFRLVVYPNPFNPQTTISFELPLAGHVRVTVYSILGQLLDVLVDEYKPAGFYEISYQPPVLDAAGIYVVRVETEEAVMLRKVTLLK